MAARDRLDLFQVPCVRIGADILGVCAQDACAAGAGRVLIVTSAPIARYSATLSQLLSVQGLASRTWLGPDGEPTRVHVDEALAVCADFAADFVIGLGGGSALDVAKLVAALHGSGQTFDRIIGIDQLAGRALQLACIPTTAGTGSEVTPIAVIEDEAAQLKKGVVSRYLVPDYAYLDATLTVSKPRKVTASTGIDALTHCIEAYANRFAHPVVDGWALEGVRLVAQHLERACDHPEDLAAREGMLIASHLGGLCLGPVNTAAVHALAYPLGGEFHVAHGVANSLLLPHVIRFNAELEPRRYADIARAMGVGTGVSEAEDAAACVAEIERLSAAVGIDRRLSDVGISANALPGMAAAAITVQRLLRNNPREVTEADALRIYEAAL